jgi:CHAD domain-containing protein
MALLSKAAKDEFDTPVERLLASIANLRQQPTSKGAHFFRTSLRRFQAWSDVFHPRVESEQKQALRFLEKVNKKAGKLRDSEIHLELLDLLSDGNVREKRKLKKTLKSLRRSYEKKLKKLLQDPILSGIWRAIRVMDKAPAEPGTPPVTQPMPGMAALAVDEYRAFVERRGNLSQEHLHEYRLECKRFRYTAELAGDDAKADALVQAWKSVQDAIGDWHDYLILAKLAEETIGGSSIHLGLVKHTHNKFAEAEAIVEQTEKRLLVRPKQLTKKGPGRAGSERQSPRVA